jgi:hypothetical protein
MNENDDDEKVNEDRQDKRFAGPDGVQDFLEAFHSVQLNRWVLHRQGTHAAIDRIPHP